MSYNPENNIKIIYLYENLMLNAHKVYTKYP
jgi:hypothetical protein